MHRRPFLHIVAVLSLAIAATAPAAEPQPIRQLAFSPDGRLLAAASGEINEPGSLVVWDWRSARQVAVHREDVGVATVSFSPSGETLAIGMFGPAAKLISPETSEVIRELRGHTGHARSVAFLSDQLLATGSYDRSVRLWNTATGEQLAELGQHDHELRDIAASPDGKWLISGARSPDVRLWNIPERRLEAEFKPSDLICPTVAFSRDGTLFLTGRWDATLRVRETGSHALRASIRTNSRGFDLAPDNRTLLVVHDQPTIQLYKVAFDTPNDELRRRIDALIATWHDDGYNKREEASRALVELGLIAEPQLREAMGSASPELRIRARRARAAILSPEPNIVDVGHQTTVNAVRCSPDGRLVASGDADGIVKIWELSSRKAVAELRTFEDP